MQEAKSTPVSVAPARATKLSFLTTPPAAVIAGSALPLQMVKSLREHLCRHACAPVHTDANAQVFMWMCMHAVEA